MPGEEVEVRAGVEEPVAEVGLVHGDEGGQNQNKTWKKLESIQDKVLEEEWPKLNEAQEEEDPVVMGEEGWCLRKVLTLDRLPRRISCSTGCFIYYLYDVNR